MKKNFLQELLIFFIGFYSAIVRKKAGNIFFPAFQL